VREEFYGNRKDGDVYPVIRSNEGKGGTEKVGKRRDGQNYYRCELDHKP